MRALPSLLAIGLMAVGPSCGPASDARAAGFRARLKVPVPLTADEIQRLAEEAGRAVRGRTVRVQEGPITRELDDKGRVALFELLTGSVGIADGGLRVIGATTVRGLKGPATPSLSEIDATQALWIDVDTLLPRRYEKTFSMPGFGDSSYDLTFGP